jgi:catechol 2,3-dioxygenase
MHLGHVNVLVRDVDRSRDWYCNLLGLHTYHFVPGTAAFLSGDIESSHELALMQVGPDAPLQQRNQVGLHHFAFMVDTLDELKALYRRIKENSIEIAHIADHGLSLGIYVRDPDGNGLEVSYELPRDQWSRQTAVFAPDVTNLGRFSGPWEDDPKYTAKKRLTEAMPVV